MIPTGQSEELPTPKNDPYVAFADICTGMLVVGFSDGQVSSFLLDDVRAALETLEPIATKYNNLGNVH